MKLIIICGGGGKTTLTKKYPDLFLDIDDFVWSSHNMQYHKELSEAIAIEDINSISSIYKSIMVNNRHYLQTQSKIIFGHNPIYSEWIGVELLAEMKPSNYSKSDTRIKKIALQNWMDLSNAIIYDDWESFNKLIIKCSGYELLN